MLKQLLFISVIVSVLASQAGNLTVSVHYEVLCRDSIRFITQQLYPAYKAYNGIFDIELIPYGKASHYKSNGEWNFRCQHGPNECFGNQYHACVINQYPLPQSLEFVYCSMSSNNPSSYGVLEQCSTRHGISWDSIKQCYDSGEGAKLLVRNGELSKSVISRTNFVPTILFNDQLDAKLQKNALTDFMGVLNNFLKF